MEAAAAERWHRVINHLPRGTSLIESEIYIMPRLLALV
jgi:hypothetical protein